MFSTRTYAARREALRKQFASGILLFLGNEDSPMNYAANTFPFRQDSTFLYFFGIDDPGLAAVIDIDSGEEILFGDDLTLDDIVWTGFLPTVADRAARSGVALSRPAGDLAALVGEARRQGRAVRFLPPYRPENAIRLNRLLDLPVPELAGAASVEFIRAVVEMRAVKSEEEIADIEEAVSVTAEMHIAAMRMAQPGLREQDIAAKVTEISLARGGGLSFPVIATIHGETLHNHHHGNVIQEGDLFLLDCGAQTTRGYAGDMTSTFPVGRAFTPRQKDVYQIVLGALEKASAALRPDVPFKEVHLLACEVIAAGMKGLGLMKGNPADAVAAGAHAMFFQCGLGHMMGLDVHDMEDLGEVWVGYEGVPKSTQFGLKSLRLARKLKPGFVFTVEPGAYFIPQLMDRWEAEGLHKEFLAYDKIKEYKGFGGIRIEENFLVTETGCRRLGTPKPKTVEEVEALRG